MSVTGLLRLLANMVAASVGLAATLLLAWLAINLFDVPLTPAARTMLAAAHDPYPDSDNLYVAFAGFRAPSGQSMIETGLSQIEASNRANDRLRTGRTASAPPYGSRTRDLDVNVDTPGWEKVTDFPWRGARAHVRRLARLLAANQELYERYLALHALRGYFDISRPGVVQPDPYIPPPIQQLFLAQTAREIQSGTHAQRRRAVTELARDLRMWRTVLDGGGDLMSKMLAADALNVDLHFLGDMVTDPDCDLSFLRRRSLLRPFPLKDWKIGAAFRWEMRREAALLDTMHIGDPTADRAAAGPRRWLLGELNRVAAQFFKVHATENLLAEQMARRTALANGDPASFLQRRQVFRRGSRRHLWLGHPPLYNPLGRAVLAFAFTPPGPVAEYAARVFDIAAFQRLVYLAYQIRKRGIAFDAVSAFMARHPRWATHPIGGKPFLWNPARGTLAVVPAAGDAGGPPLRLTLPQPASPGRSVTPRLCRGQL